MFNISIRQDKQKIIFSVQVQEQQREELLKWDEYMRQGLQPLPVFVKKCSSSQANTFIYELNAPFISIDLINYLVKALDRNKEFFGITSVVTETNLQKSLKELGYLQVADNSFEKMLMAAQEVLLDLSDLLDWADAIRELAEELKIKNIDDLEPYEQLEAIYQYLLAKGYIEEVDFKVDDSKLYPVGIDKILRKERETEVIMADEKTLLPTSSLSIDGLSNVLYQALLEQEYVVAPNFSNILSVMEDALSDLVDFSRQIREIYKMIAKLYIGLELGEPSGNPLTDFDAIFDDILHTIIFPCEEDALFKKYSQVSFYGRSYSAPPALSAIIHESPLNHDTTSPG